MTDSITSFKDGYSFLSNFHPCLVEFEGLLYPSSEHAFQAAKTNNRFDRIRIRDASTAGRAKRAGSILTLREDWEQVKVDVMLQILRDKFTRNPLLRDALLKTGDARLIEGNNWHDNFWGICSCKSCEDIPGENHLGNVLMHLRKELKDG